MLLHRHSLIVDPDILVDSLPLQEIIVSQYRSPLDSGFQALIKKFIDQGSVNPVFMDICTSILQTGKKEDLCYLITKKVYQDIELTHF